MSDEQEFAPKTLNWRISSVSGFFQIMREVAADAKLPIIVQNPAHKDFIKRPSSDPVNETKALTANQARKLMGYPAGEDVLEFRHWAILKLYLFTGARIGTGCRLDVEDFRFDWNDSTNSIHEKGRGKSKRPVGIHPEAAEAIHEYIEKAQLAVGPLFRARLNSRSQKLGNKRISLTVMYELLCRYLTTLPRSHKTIEVPDGTRKRTCLFNTHSLRATTATLLLKSGVDILAVQELMGHKHVTTTQIYGKRVRQTSDSASHKVPF
ncbi:MAG: integrase [Verrucomicrobiales bacterium]|jgi:integrase